MNGTLKPSLKRGMVYQLFRNGISVVAFGMTIALLCVVGVAIGLVPIPHWYHRVDGTKLAWESEQALYAWDEPKERLELWFMPDADHTGVFEERHLQREPEVRQWTRTGHYNFNPLEKQVVLSYTQAIAGENVATPFHDADHGEPSATLLVIREALVFKETETALLFKSGRNPFRN